MHPPQHTLRQLGNTPRVISSQCKQSRDPVERNCKGSPKRSHTNNSEHGAITVAAFEVKTQNTLNKTDAYN